MAFSYRKRKEPQRASVRLAIFPAPLKYKTHHLSLSSARWIQSTPSHPIPSRFLILSSHLHLGARSCPFPSGFSTYTLPLSVAATAQKPFSGLFRLRGCKYIGMLLKTPRLPLPPHTKKEQNTEVLRQNGDNHTLFRTTLHTEESTVLVNEVNVGPKLNVACCLSVFIVHK